MTDHALQYVDALREGTTYPLGTHLVTEEEIVSFARTWDDQYFHVDPAQTRHPRFQGVVASGLHTLALAHRMTLDAVYRDWAVVAGRGMDGVRFLRPVLPGMRLTGTARIERVEVNRPDMGLVSLVTRLTTEGGELLLTAEVGTYVATGP